MTCLKFLMELIKLKILIYLKLKFNFSMEF